MFLRYHPSNHEHPLNLIDLWSLINVTSESDEDEDEDENDHLVTKQDIKCQNCNVCEQEINWLHRYFYKCDHCDHYSIHKFCRNLPTILKNPVNDHTLNLIQSEYSWRCTICKTCYRRGHTLLYSCPHDNVDLQCATSWLRTSSIHHPSHKHPLVRILKPIICECDACGKEHDHKGIFYQCVTCFVPLIHTDCAFLSKKILIQQTTNNIFTHTHPLTLAYSFSTEEQQDKNNPKCRVCSDQFYNENIWIYKCDKCRYYVHIDCATSKGKTFMSITMHPGKGKLLKNYEDEEHPNLLHLPFPDESYNLLKSVFFNESGSTTTSLETKKLHISHQHPLILVDDTKPSSSSRIKSLSYHNPMKKIQLLCNGCLRPIVNSPFYTCANEEEDELCNSFVLHEWCTWLPAAVKDHPGHPEHTLVYFPNVPDKLFGVFWCAVCNLPCNGFAYSCVKCQYHIDVNCAFIPKEITHKAHPNHLLSIALQHEYFNTCRMCSSMIFCRFSLRCQTCDIHLHPKCALLLNQTITHKCDTHPMKLSYYPAENHKGEYFCEICEEELNPEMPFYHCHECHQSIHPPCAPSILQSETNCFLPFAYKWTFVFEYLNIKFGGIYKTQNHPHPLSFAQGIATDGTCANCHKILQHEMIFKCQQCDQFAIHYNCRRTILR